MGMEPFSIIPFASMESSSQSDISASPDSTDTPPVEAHAQPNSADHSSADEAPGLAFHSSSDVLVPRTSKHWEQRKDAIHDLYLKQNKRLQDVIEIMEDEHSFKAT